MYCCFIPLNFNFKKLVRVFIVLIKNFLKTGTNIDKESCLFQSQMKVMDNNLFTIEPRKGKLDPGECGSVTFSYKHFIAGTDRLPVLLKLARGREILVH